MRNTVTILDLRRQDICSAIDKSLKVSRRWNFDGWEYAIISDDGATIATVGPTDGTFHGMVVPTVDPKDIDGEEPEADLGWTITLYRYLDEGGVETGPFFFDEVSDVLTALPKLIDRLTGNEWQ